MTQITKWECFTFAAAAEALGVAVWRVRYAVGSGYLPRPGVVFRRRALFSPGQLEWMRAYFERDTVRRPAPAGTTPCPPHSPGTSLRP
jgi:hypothetical protein